ncbi:MAG: hypothetical protein R6V56_08415 [Lentisphaeria bacterium]
MIKKLTTNLLWILIIATVGVGAVVSLPVLAQDGRSGTATERGGNNAARNESGANQILPGYPVKDPARDPFHTKAQYRAAQGRILTPQQIVKRAAKQLSINGVIGEDSERGSVIIDGKLYGVGEDVKTKLGGKVYEISIQRLQLEPLGVIFAYKGKMHLRLVANQ